MSKLFLGISVGFLLGLLTYFTVGRLSSGEWISGDFAIVTIKNNSGQNAKSVLLKHENGTLEAHGLADDGEIKFAFENGGENAYHIIVVLDNDVTLTSNEVYFETGYRATETINEDEIVTENNW